MERKHTMSLNETKGRALSANDVEILTKAYNAIHGVLRSYWVGEEPMGGEAKLHNPTQVNKVAARLLDASKCIEVTQRKALLGKVRDEVKKALEPHIQAANVVRAQLVALSPEVQALLRQQGSLKDEVRVPLAVVTSAFKVGTTIDYMKSIMTDLKYDIVSTRGRNATWEIVVPLVVKPAPKSVPQMIAENQGATMSDDDCVETFLDDDTNQGETTGDNGPSSQAAE